MGMPVTVKGQVTIRAHPRPAELTPGSKVEFAIEADGRVFLRKAGQGGATASGRLARLRPAPGWNGMTTDEIMKLTRGED